MKTMYTTITAGNNGSVIANQRLDLWVFSLPSCCTRASSLIWLRLVAVMHISLLPAYWRKKLKTPFQSHLVWS